jgi:hypothetical protein
MISRRTASNIYLAFTAFLLLSFVLGCRSIEERRRDRILYTELSFHEQAPLSSPDTNKVLMAEVAGMKFPMRATPFLSEASLVEAAIIDSPGGGYSLRLKFNDHGRLVVDSFTASNRGRRVGVHVRYGVRKETEVPLKQKWLAAPRISRNLIDGVIVFTPDTTREELDVIVQGLVNAAEENQRPWVF